MPPEPPANDFFDPPAGSFPGKAFFDAVYRGAAPWDVGAPQRDLLRLIKEFPPSGTVLDLGCGTGDLVIELGRIGIPAIGVDFAERAIEVARDRLGEAGNVDADVRFETGDALRPSKWKGMIGSVVDCGFYHLFDHEQRTALVRDLRDCLPVAGRFYLLGFAIEIPAPDVPRQITPDELRAHFSEDEGWSIVALRPAHFQTVGFSEIPAIGLCAERLAD